jgi:adenine-specific DNA-methyltransferase
MSLQVKETGVREREDVSLDGEAHTRNPNEADSGSGTRYLGSKVRVTRAILDLVGAPRPGSVFVDAFAGTGVVAREAALRGWPVRLNDHLYCACTMAGANVLSEAHVPFAAFGSYQDALRDLSAAPAREGFIWREYSPASAGHAPAERRYFTEANAAAIDGARARIATWRNEEVITNHEETLLIADLLLAANRVANTAGTYGCFLRRWMPNAIQPLTLAPRMLLATQRAVEMLNGDVTAVPASPADVVYFDPPYTKRQYAAYYHVLETIAHGDTPEVAGVTGLRPWRERASDFCYRTRALKAIVGIIGATPAARVFLSYSSEGHVDLGHLRGELAGMGDVAVHSLGPVGRYAPNEQARRGGASVVEYLVELQKRDATPVREQP